MRKLLAASALLLAIGAAPATARDYPWCSKTPDTGGFPQCSFMTFEQCVATVSGLGGDCVQNPAIGYGQGYGQGYDQGGQGYGRGAGSKKHRGRDADWQNGGWNYGPDDRRW